MLIRQAFAKFAKTNWTAATFPVSHKLSKVRKSTKSSRDGLKLVLLNLFNITDNLAGLDANNKFSLWIAVSCGLKSSEDFHSHLGILNNVKALMCFFK